MDTITPDCLRKKAWQEKNLKTLFGSAEPQTYKTLSMAALARRLDQVDLELERIRKFDRMTALVLAFTSFCGIAAVLRYVIL